MHLLGILFFVSCVSRCALFQKVKSQILKDIFMMRSFLGYAIVLFLVFPGFANGYMMDDLMIHGFISQGYMKSDDNNFLAQTEDGSFQFNEMGINFTSVISTNLHLGMQFFARDQGKYGNDEVRIDWAFGDYHFKDFLGIRVGKIKVPMGLYNEYRDMDMLRTSILLPQSCYPEPFRDTSLAVKGAGVYGLVPLGKAGSIQYQAVHGAIHMDLDSPIIDFNQDARPYSITDIDTDDVLAGTVFWSTPIHGDRYGSLRIGGTYYESKLSTTASLTEDWIMMVETPFGLQPVTLAPGGTPLLLENDPTLFIGGSVEYVRGRLTIAAEYLSQRIDISMSIPGTGMPPAEFDIEAEGYYASASYRFCDWFELGTYYSEFYPDKDDKDGDKMEPDYLAWLKDFSLTTRFDINPFWTIKLEGHLMDGAAYLLASDNPEGFEEEWFLFIAKTTFSF